MKSIKNIIHTVKTSSPILYGIVILHLLMAVGCFIGLLVDDRTLMGINVWIKPLKFTISGAIYIFTFGYLITLYPFSTKKKNIINNINSWTLLLEISIIVYQAARGVQSHYNMSSAFDGMLFAAMGILIGINVLIMVFFIIETLRLRLKTPRPVQWAILMGWIIIVAGSWIGGQMISQVAHTVGVADGGAGLPILNWSTVAGDLRVAHFFGLHSIQIIPLFAVWLSKKWNTTTRNQVIGVVLFGLLFAGWIGFTFYQAKQGMPFIKL
ncbi:hypothetical protein GCM10011344_13670 [Dokdonia pacifica]|uniref:Uncharacterized protein n=1 Tax=Dokdonia pacifica TaxID=1627892 RepID=A0A238W8H8_9FLAO|nr:hypothetical protein [Dokdonia pacifica]GGG14305.1 hypothetical protein GCM10011344_13670 [Dokdonia pacifica]SNR42594.1 hypothetical protein SAMN06265376_101781 [Dokdonia pacifica]